jgi:multicomponent Na+:H+ antiporter subunit G
VVALDIVSWVCLSLGAVFCIIGGVGMLRLPEFYSRTHAASITDTMGAGLVLIGLLFQTNGDWMVAIKLGFVMGFMLLINPAASHALAKAAFAGGVKFNEPEAGEADADSD